MDAVAEGLGVQAPGGVVFVAHDQIACGVGQVGQSSGGVVVVAGHLAEVVGQRGPPAGLVVAEFEPVAAWVVDAFEEIVFIVGEAGGPASVAGGDEDRLFH